MPLLNAEIAAAAAARRGSGKIIPAILGVLLLLTAAFSYYVDRNGPIRVHSGPKEPTAAETKLEEERVAREMCGYDLEALTFSQIFVKQQLKAPSTAEFGYLADSQVLTPSCGIWSVKSFVDAENAFGAKLRKPYYARMEKQGTDWQLLELKLE